MRKLACKQNDDEVAVYGECRDIDDCEAIGDASMAHFEKKTRVMFCASLQSELPAWLNNANNHCVNDSLCIALTFYL